MIDKIINVFKKPKSSLNILIFQVYTFFRKYYYGISFESVSLSFVEENNDKVTVCVCVYIYIYIYIYIFLFSGNHLLVIFFSLSMSLVKMISTPAKLCPFSIGHIISKIINVKLLCKC